MIWKMESSEFHPHTFRVHTMASFQQEPATNTHQESVEVWKSPEQSEFKLIMMKQIISSDKSSIRHNALLYRDLVRPNLQVQT